MNTVYAVTSEKLAQCLCLQCLSVSVSLFADRLAKSSRCSLNKFTRHYLWPMEWCRWLMQHFTNLPIAPRSQYCFCGSSLSFSCTGISLCYTVKCVSYLSCTILCGVFISYHYSIRIENIVLSSSKPPCDVDIITTVSAYIVLGKILVKSGRYSMLVWISELQFERMVQLYL